MKHLYYVRHGLSQANVSHVWGTDAALTEEGLHQAKAAGTKAAAEHFIPDLIIVSPLIRATKTAEIIAEAIGYPLQKILSDSRLKERYMGDLEGKPQGDRLPGTPNYKQLDSIPRVEKMEALQARTAAYLTVLKQRPEDTILIVGHAAFGRCLRRVVAGRPYTDEYDAEFKKIPNAEIFQLF